MADTIIDMIYKQLGSENIKMVKYTNILGDKVIKIKIDNIEYLVTCEEIEKESE